MGVVVNEVVEVEFDRMQCLLAQTKALVIEKRITVEDAVLIVGNLVNMDAHEPSNELEKVVFDWMEEMETYFV